MKWTFAILWVVEVPRDPGCWVFLPTCPNQTDLTWNFTHWHYDNFENAEYYRERCLQRKFEWDDWCGITTSRTEFVGYGNLFHSILKFAFSNLLSFRALKSPQFCQNMSLSRFAPSGNLTKVKRRQKRVYLNQYWSNKNVQFLMMMQKML